MSSADQKKSETAVEEQQQEILKTKLEKDEKELYRHHLKAYRFDKTEWKERGDGDLVIAQKDSYTRVLMHRDYTGKCAVNFAAKNTQIGKLNGNNKAITVSCMDLSDGEAKETVFAFKFKEEADAEKFEKLLKEHANVDEKSEKKEEAKDTSENKQ